MKMWGGTILLMSVLAVSAPAKANFVTLNYIGNVTNSSDPSLGTTVPVSITLDTSIAADPSYPSNAPHYLGAITDFRIGSFDGTSGDENLIRIKNDFYNNIANAYTDSFQARLSQLTALAFTTFVVNFATGDTAAPSDAVKSSDLPTGPYDPSKFLDATFALSISPTYEHLNDGQVVTLGGTLELAPVVAGVPEPSTWAMMIIGFAGIGFMAYRSKIELVAAQSAIPYLK